MNGWLPKTCVMWIPCITIGFKAFVLQYKINQRISCAKVLYKPYIKCIINRKKNSAKWLSKDHCFFSEFLRTEMPCTTIFEQTVAWKAGLPWCLFFNSSSFREWNIQSLRNKWVKIAKNFKFKVYHLPQGISAISFVKYFNDWVLLFLCSFLI